MTAQQLKNSILQMAVQGKLVPQDPSDEPASVLLERIRAEKEQMVKEGKIKKDNNPSIIFRGDDNLPYEKIGNAEPICITDEIPFNIPVNWEIVRLKTVCQLIDGEKIIDKTFPIMDAKFLRGKGEPQYSKSGKYVTKGTELILVDGENSGEVFIAPQNGYMGSTFKALWISTELCETYVLNFIELYRTLLKNSKRGAAIPHLNKELFYNLCLPIPPLFEQVRITKSLENIRPAIAVFDKAERTLNLLNDNFPDQLKNSILQMAVQGKLVPQDPNDEPASVLLGKIRTEKEQLIKKGKIKCDKHEATIYRRGNSYYEKVDGLEKCIDDEIPFEIPDSWEWARLKNITIKITDGTHHSPINNCSGDYMYITAKNIKDSGVDLSDVTYVNASIHNEIYSRCNPEMGDVLLIKDGATTGTVTVNNIDKPFSMLSSVALLKLTRDISSWYLVYVLRSDLFNKKIRSEMKGTGITRITLRQIEPILVPIPPINEQERIVHKIKIAMDDCERIPSK